jgi:hypothetical protein
MIVWRGIRAEISWKYRQLMSNYQTRTVVLVTRTVTTMKITRFTNPEYADMHLMYCFCGRNSLAALREYQPLYPYRRQPYRRVFETAHRNLRERALSCRINVLAVEDTACGMRRMCWISYTITDQPALGTFLLQQGDFLRVQYGVLCVRISCIRFTHIQHKGWSQGTNISVYSSLDGCNTVLWTNLNLCAVCCGLMRRY